MQHTRHLRLSVLATLVAAPLALTGAPANAVTGTAVTDTTYAFTARLEIGEGETGRACSGALIDTEWLLTAASCFADNPAASLDVPAGRARAQDDRHYRADRPDDRGRASAQRCQPRTPP